jgi:MarR family 2-MHQ and catechol resistance regulon transcriptional repressor
MGTHYKGTIKQINSLNVYIKLLRASDSIRERINTSIFEKGLTESQFNMLDALFHLGPLSQSELGKKLFKSGGNITMVVDNLEKRKLVKRERGQNDRRLFMIHLTKKGNNLIENLFPGILSAIVAEINVLSENEQLEFQRMCKLLGLPKTSLKL